MPQSAASPGVLREAVARGVRYAALGAVLIGLLAVLLPTGMGWLAMWGLTHPRCGAGGIPEAYQLEAEPVEVPARTGVSYQGYFFRGTNEVSIIVPPAYASGRGGLLHEVAILVEGGYSVLTYDSRPCAGLAVHSLGIWEAEDIVDALDYLRTRADVDITRVGLHGFSQAGASNLFVAARLPEVRAVVAEGGYVDYGAQTLGLDRDQGLLMTLFVAGARLGYRMATGLPLEALRPLDHLGAAPPPILLVYGEHELTLHGARAAAESSPMITLWTVPGGRHGSYVASAGREVYAARVLDFFDAALQPVP